jgi:hypothetical protein
MTKAKITLGGVAAVAGLLASPAFAAKTTLDNADLSQISGQNNIYTFGSVADSSITNSQDASANISIGWFQWQDDHSNDLSDHKGSNDQSGSATAVQQHVTATVNSIAWGSLGQSAVVNSGKVTLSGPLINMAYGVFAAGGF